MIHSRPCRVAYWLEFPTVSGGERSLLALLERLDRRRFKPVAVAPTEGPLPRALRALDVPVAPDPGDEMKRSEWVRDQAIALMHANSLAMGCRIGPVSRRTGVPSVAHVRDIMRLGGDRRAALNLNRALVAVSRAVARALVAASVPGSRIRVIPNGIDPDAAAPRSDAGKRLRAELGLAMTCPVVGTVGQICLRKAQDVFLEAAAHLAREAPEVRFVIIGSRFSGKAESREFEAALVTRARRAPLAGKVHFLGWRDDAAELIAGLSVLAHPAHQEPLGRVLLEALAAGTPIVATDVGGTPEIVDHEDSGLLVPRGDARALAGGVKRLLNSGSLADHLARNGRARVRERFSPATMTRAVQSLYEEVLAAD
jgi:glycosyltransferase involved in cell wall biosynthesis